MTLKTPKEEFFESIGHLIFWSIVFGMIMVALIVFDRGDCPNKNGATYDALYNSDGSYECIITSFPKR